MKLRGKVGLIKYARRLAGIGLIEAKEIVDVFYNFYEVGNEDVWNELEIIRFSIFFSKIKNGSWVIRDGKVIQEKVVSFVDIENLTEF